MALQRVETDAIEDDAITTDKIAANAVAAADIAADAITNAKVAAGAAIASSKLSGLGTAATLTAGTSANNVVQLDGSGNIPVVNGSAVTNLTSANLIGALPPIDGSNLTGVSTDTSAMENNIAILAFKTQSANNLAKFNLVGQVVDEYKDGTGATYTTASQVGSTAADGYLATIFSTTTTSASGEWSSTTGINFGTGDDMSYSNGDKSTRTNDSFSGDVTVTFTIGSDSGSNNQNWFGFYDIADSQAFGEGDQYGDTNDMTLSWVFRPVTTSVWYGGTSLDTGISHPAAGSVIKFKRVGTTISLLDDDVTIYTWAAASSGTLRFFMGRGGVYSAIDNTDISWTVPGADYATGTAISTANTALTSPTTGDICMLIENAGSGAAVLGTNIKAFVSRNGGTNWYEATGDYALTDVGTWGSGTKKILTANNIPFAGPAGTDMRYKIEWAGQAEGTMVTRVHATSLAWA